VAPVEGTVQFLQAAGFKKQILPNPQQEMEDFWVYSDDRPNKIEFLSVIYEILSSCSKIIKFIKFICYQTESTGWFDQRRTHPARIGSRSASASAQSGCAENGIAAGFLLVDP
jgi:hypothetical protein